MPTSTITTIVSPASYTPLYISTEGLIDKRTSDYKPSEVFSFSFEGDYVYLISNNGYYLSADPISRSVTWTRINNKSLLTDIHKFNYHLTNKTIILFVYNTFFKQIIKFNEGSSPQIHDILPSVTSFPSESVIHIDILEKKSRQYNHLTDSFTAKYSTQSLSEINTIQLIKSTDYNQNFIFNIPLDNNSDSVKTYINSLKNYYTSTYNNSIYPTINSSLSSIHRDYTNIFTGSNQSKGYQNIYLNFISNTLSVDIPKDSTTIFTAPAIIPVSGIALSSSSLYYDGAVAGACPYVSDRIAFSARDYRELSISASPSDIIDGTWQYSWLSAGPAGTATWMDRYYYGANLEIDEQQNLFSIPSTLSNVIDVPSSLKILPNRKYKYFHQGKNNINSYIDSLKYIYTDTSAEILQVKDWGSTTITDLSINKNNGELVGDTDLTNKNYFLCNGSNYAIFPSTPSMQEDGELYTGVWVEVEDWSNIQGNQILGNFADGGYGLFNKQIIPTNIITLYDNINNYFYNINSELNIINESYNVIPADSTDEFNIIRHSDLKFTFINLTKKYLVKYDINFNIIFAKDFNTELDDVSQVESNSNEDIFLYSKSTGKIVGYNLNYTTIYSQDVSIYGYDRIEVGNGELPSYGNVINYNNVSKDYIVGVYGDLSVIDNAGDIWVTRGQNLYKNKSYIATIGVAKQLTVDSKGNLWILHGKNVSKIDTLAERILFTKQFFTSENGLISFITNNINYKETDIALLMDIQEKSITLVLLDGTIYNKIYLDNLKTSFFAKNNFTYTAVIFNAKGDFTGYDYQRKFRIKAELEWRFTLSTSKTYNPITHSIINLSLPVKDLPNNTKHYFSFSFSTSKGNISVYIDGEKVNEYNFSPFNYRLANSSRAFSLAANTSKQGLLSDTINLTTENKFKGKIYSIHKYKYAFNQEDVRCFNISQSEQDLYKDLKWNIKTGNRNYIEEIDRFFTFSMPGSKSKLYDIRISGFSTTDEHRLLISKSLSELLPTFAPADTSLRDIVWE